MAVNHYDALLDAVLLPPDEEEVEAGLLPEGGQAPESAPAPPSSGNHYDDLIQAVTAPEPEPEPEPETPEEEPGLFTNSFRKLKERVAELGGNVYGALETVGGFAEDQLNVGGFAATPGKALSDETAGYKYLPPEEWKKYREQEDSSMLLSDLQAEWKAADFGSVDTDYWEEMKRNPSMVQKATNLGAFAVETGIVSVADMAGAVAMFPLWWTSFSEQMAQERAANDGRAEPSEEDWAIAGATTAVIGAMEKFGFESIASAFVKGGTAFKKILKAAVGEGGTEFVQEQMEYGVETLGTKTGEAMTSEEYVLASLERGAQGAVGGVTIGTTMAAPGALLSGEGKEPLDIGGDPKPLEENRDEITLELEKTSGGRQERIDQAASDKLDEDELAELEDAKIELDLQETTYPSKIHSEFARRKNNKPNLFPVKDRDGTWVLRKRLIAEYMEEQAASDPLWGTYPPESEGEAEGAPTDLMDQQEPEAGTTGDLDFTQVQPTSQEQDAEPVTTGQPGQELQTQAGDDVRAKVKKLRQFMSSEEYHNAIDEAKDPEAFQAQYEQALSKAEFDLDHPAGSEWGAVEKQEPLTKEESKPTSEPVDEDVEWTAPITTPLGENYQDREKGWVKRLDEAKTVSEVEAIKKAHDADNMPPGHRTKFDALTRTNEINFDNYQKNRGKIANVNADRNYDVALQAAADLEEEGENLEPFSLRSKLRDSYETDISHDTAKEILRRRSAEVEGEAPGTVEPKPKKESLKEEVARHVGNLYENTAQETYDWAEDLIKDTTEPPLIDGARVFMNRERNNAEDFAFIEFEPAGPEGIQINSIQSSRSGRGNGAAALEEIKKLADKHGVDIQLDAEAYGELEGGLEQKDLEAWYERNGFVPLEEDSEMLVYRPKQAEIEEDATEDIEPTGEASSTAAEYQKEHEEFERLVLSFKPGDERHGRTIPHYYGEITGTESADNMPIDVVLNKDYERVGRAPIFIVNQIDPETMAFRQHKVMAGFPNTEMARKGYTDQFGPGGIGAIHSITPDKFAEWMAMDDTKLPYRPIEKDTGAKGLLRQGKDEAQIWYLQKENAANDGAATEADVRGYLKEGIYKSNKEVIQRLINSKILPKSYIDNVEVEPQHPEMGKPAGEGTGRFYTEELANGTIYDLSKSADTQVSTTKPTYDKAKAQYMADIFNKDILDYGAGRGISSKEHGFDSLEPYARGWKPDYTDTNQIKRTYDGIIANAILNVLPRHIRLSVVLDMGEMLNPGGKLFINVRGKDIFKAKIKEQVSKTEIITSKGTFQKAFTQGELKAYLEKNLGADYTVERSTLGTISVIVTKKGTLPKRRPEAEETKITPAEGETQAEADAAQKKAVGSMNKSIAAKATAIANLKPDPTSDDLLTFIRKLGGINVDQESDVRQMSLGELDSNNKMIGLPGFAQKGGKGMSLDEAAEAATEAGYILGEVTAGADGVTYDSGALLDALSKAGSGEPVYSLQNQDWMKDELASAEERAREDADAQEAAEWADAAATDKSLNQIDPETARLMAIAGQFNHDEMVDIASKDAPEADVQALLQEYIDEQSTQAQAAAGEKPADQAGRADEGKTPSLTEIAAQITEGTRDPDPVAEIMVGVRTRLETKTEKQLRDLAKDAGLMQVGTRDKLIERLVAVREAVERIGKKYKTDTEIHEAVASGEISKEDIYRFAKEIAKTQTKISPMGSWQNTRKVASWLSSAMGKNGPKMVASAEAEAEAESKIAEADARAEENYPKKEGLDIELIESLGELPTFEGDNFDHIDPVLMESVLEHVNNSLQALAWMGYTYAETLEIPVAERPNYLNFEMREILVASALVPLNKNLTSIKRGKPGNLNISFMPTKFMQIGEEIGLFQDFEDAKTHIREHYPELTALLEPEATETVDEEGQVDMLGEPVEVDQTEAIEAEKAKNALKEKELDVAGKLGVGKPQPSMAQSATDMFADEQPDMLEQADEAVPGPHKNGDRVKVAMGKKTGTLPALVEFEGAVGTVTRTEESQGRTLVFVNFDNKDLDTDGRGWAVDDLVQYTEDEEVPGYALTGVLDSSRFWAEGEDYTPMNEIELTAESEGKRITKDAGFWSREIDSRLIRIYEMRGCAK